MVYEKLVNQALKGVEDKERGQVNSKLASSALSILLQKGSVRAILGNNGSQLEV